MLNYVVVQVGGIYDFVSCSGCNRGSIISIRKSKRTIGMFPLPHLVCQLLGGGGASKGCV
jgi:hypothetical protein